MVSRYSGTTKVTTDGLCWPLHNSAATRAAETLATALHSPGALMQAAGLAVARLALAMAPHARMVQVFAGPGNNGGDGLVAARHLQASGKLVQVWLFGDPAALPPDAAAAWAMATATGLSRKPWLSHSAGQAPRCDLAIDALLGLGATRAVTGDMAQAINTLNQQGAPVLAVDVPSGLNPDTGAALGGPVVRAQNTLSLLTLKPGCFTAEGRDHAGHLWFDTLGVPAGEATAWLSGCPNSPPRPHASHKGLHGDVAVVGGARGMAGAAWLAARAALAAGAGRVFVSLIGQQALCVDAQRAELMVRMHWWRSSPDVLSRSTVVCGCGAGDDLNEVLPPLLAHAGRLVLDADALTAIASDPTLMAALRTRNNRGRGTVLTPHPLEGARLLGCSTEQVQHDRVGAAMSLAVLSGATVVLKGSGTVIAMAGTAPFINPTGNGALATAGTGDVLAGWIGGLWAQGDKPGAMHAAAAAVWLHGHAADQFLAQGRQGPLRAADLVERMAGIHT